MFQAANAPYPCTITLDRYGGTYAGALWLAWPLQPHEIPPDPFRDNLTAAAFWDEYEGIVGRGHTPAAALADLAAHLKTETEASHD